MRTTLCVYLHASEGCTLIEEEEGSHGVVGKAREYYKNTGLSVDLGIAKV